MMWSFHIVQYNCNHIFRISFTVLYQTHQYAVVMSSNTSIYMSYMSSLTHQYATAMPSCHQCTVAVLSNIYTCVASFVGILVFLCISCVEVAVERLSSMSSLETLDMQDNPLTDEAQVALHSMELVSIHTGISDPKGRELEELEWWRNLEMSVNYFVLYKLFIYLCSC